MKHISATGHSLRPAFILVEIRSEESDAIGGDPRAALAQHASHFLRTAEIAHRPADLMARRYQSKQAMGAEKARGARNQHSSHVVSFIICNRRRADKPSIMI
ncbi:hypothetical protein GCM10009087_50530 [Sphingomonas oligophenolica]